MANFARVQFSLLPQSNHEVAWCYQRNIGAQILWESFSDFNYKDLTVPFETVREAEIAHGSLSVDAEPKRGGVNKQMHVKDTVLKVHFEAAEAKALRVGVNNFFDQLALVVRTIQQFGPPKTKTQIGDGDSIP